MSGPKWPNVLPRRRARASPPAPSRRNACLATPGRARSSLSRPRGGRQWSSASLVRRPQLDGPLFVQSPRRWAAILGAGLMIDYGVHGRFAKAQVLLSRKGFAMDATGIVFFCAVGWIICGFLGGLVGNAKNAAGSGAVLGFLFGPLGVLVAFAVDGRPECPYCKGRIEPRATTCQHCRKSLSWSNDGAPRKRSTTTTDWPEQDNSAPPSDELDQWVADQILTKGPPRQNPP
jgi:hypothetical protein